MKKPIIIILTCCAVLLAGYAGYRGYRVWNQRHLISLAHDFLKKSDARNALLCIQKVLRVNPINLEATRMMADLAEQSRSPGALIWRSRVVDLNPGSFDDRMALAKTALLAREIGAATNALEGVQAADQKSAAYQNLAGTVAIAANQPALAEKHFVEAARLEPQNPVPRLNLAVIHLNSSNATAMAEARVSLQQLSQNPTNATLRCQALRELIGDAGRRRQFETALTLSTQLLQQTNSLFSDKLMRLDLLQQSKNTGFKAALGDYQREAADNQSKIYEVATWQMTRTSPKEALTWLRSLPLTVQTNQPTDLLIAQCYASVQDWHGLQTWLEPRFWAEMDFLRHALLSRALRGQSMTESSRAEWELALKTAAVQKQRLYTLLGLTAQWQWLTEGEELLWQIYNRDPGDKAARRALVSSLYAGGRTRSLMQVFSQDLKRVPGDLEAKNNLAVTAMLLDAQEVKPHDLAAAVYRASPTNSAYASTYAYSLHLQDKKTEALKVMAQLQPQQLDDPSVAGYYGVILESNGDRARALAYLTRATKQTTMLPEERVLFTQALSKAGKR